MDEVTRSLIKKQGIIKKGFKVNKSAFKKNAKIQKQALRSNLIMLRATRPADLMGNKNFRDGKFEVLKSRMIRMVDGCKTIDDVKWLQRETSYGLTYLKTTRSMMASGKTKKGHFKFTVKELDEYINWNQTVFRDKLKEKRNEIMQEVRESVIDIGEIVQEGTRLSIPKAIGQVARGSVREIASLRPSDIIGAKYIRDGNDLIRNGNFDSMHGNFERNLKMCRTADDIKSIRMDINDEIRKLKRFRNLMAKGKIKPEAQKRIKFTLEELDKEIDWLENTFKSKIDERKKEISNKVHESLDIDEYLNEYLMEGGSIMNVKDAVRSWRIDILSDGTNIDTASVAKSILKPDQTYLESTLESITCEVKREIESFNHGGPVSDFPVIDLMECILDTVNESSGFDICNVFDIPKPQLNSILESTMLAAKSSNTSNLKPEKLTRVEYDKVVSIVQEAVESYPDIKAKIIEGVDLNKEFCDYNIGLSELPKILSIDICKTDSNQELDNGIAERIVQLVSDVQNTVCSFNINAKLTADDSSLDNGKIVTLSLLSQKDPIEESYGSYDKWMQSKFASMFERNKTLIDSINETGRIYASNNINAIANTVAKTVVETGFNPNQRNLNEITPIDGSEPFVITPFNAGVRTVGNVLCDICEAETDDELTEAMIKFARVTEAINKTYSLFELEDDDIVEESIGSAARGAARKARTKIRSVTRKVDKTARGFKQGVNKAIDPMVQFIDQSMMKIKKADAEERREIIIRGGMLPKIMRWLKRSIGLIIGGAVGTQVPVVAIITGLTFLGYICTDKYFDMKERSNIMKQLEDEIEMVNEKIDDARGDSNRQKKYELMRIRSKLKRTSDKIRYNLKVVGADEDIVQNLKTKKANVK